MELQIEAYLNGRLALIVEDDENIANLLKIHLTTMGFIVDCCGTAEEAEEQISKKAYDLCLLDWMLPKMQGIEFLQVVRKLNFNTRVMMVTAKVDPDSIVHGLDAGADDYLPKPFELRVLAARVRQLMRRHRTHNFEVEQSATRQSFGTQTEFNFGGLFVHFTKHIVKCDGIDVHLTPSEFKLLVTLVKAQGRVLARHELIDQIQGEDVTVTGRTIDTHIFALRKKIGNWASHIETIRGIGYRVLISTDDKTEISVESTET